MIVRGAPLRRIQLIAPPLILLALAGCGGGGGVAATASGPATTSQSTSRTDVVARVGPNIITRSQLREWMPTELAEDFYAASGHALSANLVSEPADYAGCHHEIAKLTPTRGKGRPQPAPSHAKLTDVCHELYDAIKLQTLNYLVTAYWTMRIDAVHGTRATDLEVRHAFNRLRAAQHEGVLEAELVAKRRTLSQELFQVKLALLQEKLVRKSGNLSVAITELAQSETDPALEADCMPGYVVTHCKQYKGGGGGYPGGRSPSIIVQEIARWRPLTSHGFTGVPLCTHGRTKGCV